MKSDKLNPIIFLPGLMGSIGGEMLGYKINWSFGMASWFYSPFIRDLENLGYRLDENLFICYYDWTKNCTEIVENFLKPLLRKVENKNPNKKIDLLCHSMGGIVARTYIQSEDYQFNIRNLFCLGTPNKGSLQAYYLWIVGKEIKISDEENQLFDIIRKGYVWLLSKVLNIPLGRENIEKLHENFPGIKDLIPSDNYVEILCYKTDKGYKYYPRKYTIGNNDLLNYLNEDIIVLNNRVENVYCFIGINNKTDKFLILDSEELLENNKGYVKGTLSTLKGDGTVTAHSASIENARNFILEGSHTKILRESIKYISEIYNLNKSSNDIPREGFKEYPLSIILKKYINIELKNKKETIAKVKSEELVTESEYICLEFGKDYVWFIFKNIPKGDYTLNLYTKRNEDNNILIISPSIEEELRINNLKKSSKDNGVCYEFKV